MGGGIAGWLTPGWTIYDHRAAPSIAQPDFVKTKLAAAEDPKPELLELCKPQCEYWAAKLKRCEIKLE